MLRAVSYIGMYNKREQAHPGKWGRLVAQNLEQASQFSITDVGQAMADQTDLYRRAQLFFREFDLLITPTVGRRNEDLKVMHAAIALEQLLARNPLTARPLPDLVALEKVKVRDEMEPVV